VHYKRLLDYVRVPLISGSRESSVGIATYWLDSRGSNSGRGNIFHFPTTSRPVLGSPQPIIQWVLEHIYIYIAVVCNNLLFTKSLFEVLHGIYDTPHSTYPSPTIQS
jgi:hypothetical protein